MVKTMMPGYTIGVDAYGDIKNVCPVYGKKVAVIGGKRALEAAEYAIVKAVEEAKKLHDDWMEMWKNLGKTEK